MPNHGDARTGVQFDDPSPNDAVRSTRARGSQHPGRASPLSRVRLAVTAIVATVALVVSYEEISFRTKLDAILLTLPQRVAYGESLDVLADAKRIHEAHPFALSRATASVLGTSLIEAERIEIGAAASANRFAEARRRIAVLAGLADRSEQSAIASLRQTVERRAQVLANLRPWMQGEGAQRAFVFDEADSDQVRELYASLSDGGRAGVRQRFLELGTPSGLPAFVECYLDGEQQQPTVASTPESSTIKSVSTLDVLRRMIDKPHTVTWKRARDAAYTLVIDAWLQDELARKERARELFSLFVEAPAVLPETRERLQSLAIPPR